jgi:hypothetical protein
MSSDKYTFRRETTDLYGQIKTSEHTIEAETLDEIVEEFLYFLNGCSFSYVKDIIFVKSNGTEVSVMGECYDEPNLHAMAGITSVEDFENQLIDLEKKFDPMP